MLQQWGKQRENSAAREIAKRRIQIPSGMKKVDNPLQRILDDIHGSNIVEDLIGWHCLNQQALYFN